MPSPPLRYHSSRMSVLTEALLKLAMHVQYRQRMELQWHRSTSFSADLYFGGASFSTSVPPASFAASNRFPTKPLC